MQTAVIAELDQDFLSTTTADSDRFVYSNYVMPLRITFDDGVTPILPEYKRMAVRVFTRAGLIGPGVLEAMPDLDLGDVGALNSLELNGNPVVDAPESTDVESPVAVADLANGLAELIGGYVAETELVDGEGAFARTRATRTEISEASSALVRAARRLVPALPDAQLEPTLDAMIEFFIGLVESDIAYLFLDRTRIQPSGFRIGEHVYALSLTPGEEVTLEQRTFSKRQVTFEEQNEQDVQFELELASTLSTELQEGFNRQKSITDTWGLSVGKVGSYSSPVISDVAYGSFNTNHSIAYTKNIATADQETRSRSTKDSKTASARVASTYRTSHKTTFRVATEQMFESTAKRVIRNPNAFTPVTLHYFKVLQLVKMTHERYGARLGWTPFLKDPAYGFFQQIRDGRAKILADAEAALPAKPDDPSARPAPADDQTVAPTDRWYVSEIVAVGTGAADGSLSGDITVDVSFEDGWEWDGNVAGIVVDQLGPRPKEKWDASVKGFPVVVKAAEDAGSALRVIVHVGAQEDAWKRRMMEIQVKVRFLSKPAPAAPLPTDEKGAEQAAAYAIALRDWAAKCDELRAQARSAADEWEAAMFRSLNPVGEMIDQLIEEIKDSLPADVRNAAWEIQLWQRLFDWERASYVPYPGWWADGPLRDPTRDPSDFVNASWARLYLPVRVGMERLALRWIHRFKTGALDAATEARFDTIEDDLKEYRREKFGGDLEMMTPDDQGVYREKYEKIATWTELLPTDGTHVEVVQAFSMAADEVTLAASDEWSKLRQADARLKETAVDQLTEPARLRVTITTDGTDGG